MVRLIKEINYPSDLRKFKKENTQDTVWNRDGKRLKEDGGNLHRFKVANLINFANFFQIYKLWLTTFKRSQFYVTTPAILSFCNFGLNPLHSNISMHILHTVLYTFPWALVWRICLLIASFFSWWSSPLFSWPQCLTQERYCKEKVDASHSKDWKG